jgi:hypothetical protein
MTPPTLANQKNSTYMHAGNVNLFHLFSFLNDFEFKLSLFSLYLNAHITFVVLILLFLAFSP